MWSAYYISFAKLEKFAFTMLEFVFSYDVTSCSKLNSTITQFQPVIRFYRFSSTLSVISQFSMQPRKANVSTNYTVKWLKGWILCYTVDPPNLIPSNRQVIRRSKVSANHLIIRVIKYCRAETTARFRGPSGVYSLT